MNKSTRTEYDTMGALEVPSERIWGAQTQRSLINFEIGTAEDKMPEIIIKAMAIIKKAAALANKSFGLSPDISSAIVKSAEAVIENKFNSEFPLVIFQTGSGTQSNMNMNEVLSNVANLESGRELGDKTFVHPNDHVNKSQSSNDTYPTAMHVAIFMTYYDCLKPALAKLHLTLEETSEKYGEVIKLGRTHIQDATPLSLKQEISGYAQLVANGIERIEAASQGLLLLAQGGTAVGTGLNTPEGFDVEVAAQIAKITGHPFKTALNKFEALSSHDAVTYFSGALSGFSTSLFKVANDLKLLKTTFDEISFDSVDACDEVQMSCLQVIGNNTAVTIGSAFLTRYARTF